MTSYWETAKKFTEFQFKLQARIYHNSLTQDGILLPVYCRMVKWTSILWTQVAAGRRSPNDTDFKQDSVILERNEGKKKKIVAVRLCSVLCYTVGDFFLPRLGFTSPLSEKPQCKSVESYF